MDNFDNSLLESTIRKNFSFSEFGPVTQLCGGYVKHTYKVVLDKKPYVFQIWKEPDTFMTSTNDKLEDALFCNNLENLIGVQKIFKDNGIKSPEILFADTSKKDLPYDFALMEYISGGDLFKNNQKFTDLHFLKYIGNLFGKLNSLHRPERGLITRGPLHEPPYTSLIEETTSNLDLCLKYGKLSLKIKNTLIDTLFTLKENFKAKKCFNLVYPDFKPDHILFNDINEPVLIDCEDVQYYEIEYQIAMFSTPSFSFSNCDLFYSAYFENRHFEIDYSKLAFYQIYGCISCLSFAIEYLFKSQEKDELYERLEEDGLYMVNCFLSGEKIKPYIPESLGKYSDRCRIN